MKAQLIHSTVLVFLMIFVIGSLGFVLPIGRSETKKDTSKIAVNKNLPEKDIPMPIYGNWKNYDSKNGLPADKAYCVKIDGERVFVGTHEGLAVFEKGNWKTYTTKDGLAHNGSCRLMLTRQQVMFG